jgi:hypothetical protein
MSTGYLGTFRNSGRLRPSHNHRRQNGWVPSPLLPQHVRMGRAVLHRTTPGGLHPHVQNTIPPANMQYPGLTFGHIPWLLPSSFSSRLGRASHPRRVPSSQAPLPSSSSTGCAKGVSRYLVATAPSRLLIHECCKILLKIVTIPR